MAKKVKFLDAPYAGYLEDPLPPEDQELTHVGAGTPGGEYLRRFWHPVAFSHELGDLPARVKILGEDLVLFRDGRGRAGLLKLHCCHRGASLEFGLVSERGIRCCYHGWLFDVDGRILETPGEPPTTTIKERLFQGAYPTAERAGLVFAYLGPPDRRPALPVYDTFELPGWQTVPGLRYVMPCNWLQIKENCMDPVHTAFLHTRVAGAQFTNAFGVVPLLQWRETATGTLYIASRRVEDRIWIRICDWMAPTIHQFPPNWEDASEEKIFGRPTATHWTVPIDDNTTLNLDIRHYREGEEIDDRKAALVKFGQMDDRPYEERQRFPADFDAQTGQRPIAIHATEHLVTSDQGVILLRKVLRQGIRDVQAGRDPKGIVREEGRVIPTLCQDTVLRIPPAPTPDADRELMLDVGRKVADGHYVAHPPVHLAGR
jgi:phenylpropionate dioxygenase-like ring-hydroxylating dioxygenase large terminal subunit